MHRKCASTYEVSVGLCSPEMCTRMMNIKRRLRRVQFDADNLGHDLLSDIQNSSIGLYG